MASRQEEKEARRKARMEAEAAEAKSATRNKRLQLVLGGVLGAGIIAAIVIAVLAGGGGSDKGGPTSNTKTSAKLPKPATADEKAAAAAAKCQLTNPADEGRSHEDKTFTPSDYKTNPPTSGNHFPQWAQDGTYTPANTPPLGQLVHTLEHGRIDVQYKPGTPKALVDKLQAFVDENDGYHMLLFENPTSMKPQIAATAWDHALMCNTASDKIWDALRTFRDAHIDRGPEKVA
jgi:hypothetical protein